LSCLERLVEALDAAEQLFKCVDDEQISDWIDRIAAATREHQDLVTCRGLVEAGRMFNFDRTIINPADIRRSSDGSGDRIVTSDPAIVESVLKKEITHAKAFFVRGARCSSCRAEYEQCSCSTTLDPGVFQELTEVEPAFLFWTDRADGSLVSSSK
jgi:hypothetical protein